MVSTNRAGWKRRAISESGDAVSPEMAQSAEAARRRLLGSGHEEPFASTPKGVSQKVFTRASFLHNHLDSRSIVEYSSDER
jgi:hypothetical protein